MRSFIATILFFLVTMTVVSTAFAAPSTAPQQAGAYYVNTGAITPSTFRKVEALFQKNHLMCHPASGWYTIGFGFQMLYDGDKCSTWQIPKRRVTLTWDGRIEFDDVLIGHWDEL